METQMVESETTDGFIFRRSFHNALKCLSREQYGDMVYTIGEYVFSGKMPKKLDPVCKGMFILIRPVIDSNLKKYKQNKDDGDKGGRPNMKDDKRAAIIDALQTGKSVKDVASECEVSERTVYAIRKEVFATSATSAKTSANCTATSLQTDCTANCTNPAQPLDFVALHNAEYTAIVNAWNNAGLPRCTSTMLANVSGDDLKKVRGFFDAYGGNAQNEAVNAIRNFATMRGDSRYDLGYRNTYSFLGFLEKGVGAFTDSAKPFENFAPQKPKYGSGVTQSGCDEASGDVPF